MRGILSVFVSILAVIALLGLGLGVFVVSKAAGVASADPLGFVLALVYGSIPFAIGTIALGAVAVVSAVDKSASDQTAAINRLAEITINEAKLAAHHRAANRPPE